MKKIFNIVVICTVTLASTFGIYTVSTKGAEKKTTPYKLVWSDEFNGDSLNKNNWNYNIGNGGTNIGWGNLERQYYTDRTDNVKVEGGNLVITAKSEKYVEEGTGNKYNYTSGRIFSSGLQSFKYGRIEARMKVPAARGLWPAFWMLGYNDKGWPYCGEIDIMETWNEYNFAQGTIHWVNENSSKPTSDKYDASSIQLANKAQWHTYGLNWDKTKMEWYVDGKIYKTFSLKESDRDELKRPFYIILNLAVGGNLPHYTPNEDFVSETVLIDYVRAYQRTSDNGSYSGTWSSEDQDQVQKCKVIFKNGKKVISTQNLLEGENVQIPVAKKSKYKFLGWYSGNKKITKDTRIYANTTIKAKWKKIKVKQPVITSTKQIYKRHATIKFKSKEKVDGYQVKIGSKKALTPSNIITLGKFKSGKVYTVRGRAYKIDSGGKKIYGKWSKLKKITIR